MSIKGTNGAISSWTVLVIDDEPDNLGVPQKVLAHFGAQVHTAENGLQGLKVLNDILPTFILLDLSMPYMDGWEMLKSIRSDPRTANLPVIALTAHAMDGDRQRCLDAGMDDHLTKPFSRANLIEIIDKWATVPTSTTRTEPSPSPSPLKSGVNASHPDAMVSVPNARSRRPESREVAMTTTSEGGRVDPHTHEDAVPRLPGGYVGSRSARGHTT